MRRVLSAVTASILAFAAGAIGCADLDDGSSLADTEQAATGTGGPVFPVGFTVTADQTSQNLVAGEDADIELDAWAVGTGSCIAVTYSVTGVPAGATLVYSPAHPNAQRMCAGGWTKTVAVVELGPTMPAGTYPITFTAAGGLQHHTLTVTLVVRAPSFSVTVWPPAANLSAGQTASAALTLPYDGTWDGPLASETITLSAENVPAGVTAVFSPPTLTLQNDQYVTATFTAASGATITPQTVTLVALTADGHRQTSTLAVGPGSQLVTNGSFEAGASPWTTSGNAGLTTWSGSPYQGNFAHGGSSCMAGNANGAVMQTITIPANATSAWLAFWLTGETNASTVSVELITPTHEVFLLASYDDLTEPYDPLVLYTPPVYQRHDLDLTSFRGRTLTLRFGIYTPDGADAGMFGVDDVSIAATY